jgi:hypothetical protein
MYYYNTSAVYEQSLADEQAVWDSNHMVVLHLDETSGTHADSTSNNNNATYSGTNQNAVGKIDGTDNWNGNNEYVYASDSATLDLTGQITISFWVYPRNFSNDPDFVTKGDYTQAYSTYIRAAGTLRWGINNNWLTSTATLSTNTWYYLTFTRNNSTNGRKIYINGEESISNTYATAIGTNNNPLYIGTTDYDFDGIMDEVRVSNIARSPSWIKASYLTEDNDTAGSSGFPSYGTAESY